MNNARALAMAMMDCCASKQVELYCPTYPQLASFTIPKHQDTIIERNTIGFTIYLPKPPAPPAP